MKLILLLITLTISISNVKADQYYKMVKVTCAPELGLFEITATGMANLHEIYEPGFDLSLISKKIADKYGIYIEGQTTHTCTINNIKIKAQLNYRKPSPRGRCGGNPGALLNVSINDEKTVLNMPFHEECSDASAYNLKVSKYALWLCGGGNGSSSHCIWKDLMGKNRSMEPLKQHNLRNAIRKK